MTIQQAERLNERIELVDTAKRRCLENGKPGMSFVWRKHELALKAIQASFTDGDKRGAR